MATTWSISRDQILHTCERRYYFQYLAAARINSRDETLREIAFLKKLKSFSMWKGNAFHSLVADYFRAVRGGRSPDITGLIAERQTKMRREWNFSVTREYRSNPRAISRDGGLALFEHEYNENIGEQDFAEAVRDIEGWAHQFGVWIADSNIDVSVREAARVWIEPPTYGPRAPGFVFDGVQILTKVDLALQNPDGQFEIFDWKTGAPLSRPSRQIDRAEFQVNVYQLWPHLAHERPLDSIRAHLVYVALDPQQKTFAIDQNRREYTLGLIRRSVDRVLHFESLRKQAGLGLEDLDFAAFPWMCKRCHFKRLCQRALGNEEK